MAFLIPPCPKCSGVLRSRPDIDAARCRCGFEVDGMSLHSASRLPESGRAVYLLAHGRTVPIPQHEPGIRVGPDAGALRSFGWDHRYEPWRPGSDRAAIAGVVAATAIERRYEIGLVHAGETLAATLTLDDGSLLTERRLMYGLAPAGSESECARQMVDAISAAHGPGRWWTFAGVGAVHFILSEGDAAVCDIGGVPHVALRAIYFHDPAAKPVDPLDIEYDGASLRGLLVSDEAARHDRNIFAQTHRTPAQRAAVSAHWSAQLRAKVAASATADKAREPSVVVELEDP